MTEPKRPQKYGIEWEDYLEALKEFKARHGHTLVEAKYSVGRLRLGVWVAHQRIDRRRGKLTQERIDGLTEIAFCWDVYTKKWNDNYEEVLEFYQRHGHIKLPIGTSLESWLRKQRSPQLSLTQEQIDKLDEIGYNWRKRGRPIAKKPPPLPPPPPRGPMQRQGKKMAKMARRKRQQEAAQAMALVQQQQQQAQLAAVTQQPQEHVEEVAAAVAGEVGGVEPPAEAAITAAVGASGLPTTLPTTLPTGPVEVAVLMQELAAVKKENAELKRNEQRSQETINALRAKTAQLEKDVLAIKKRWSTEASASSSDGPNNGDVVFY